LQPIGEDGQGAFLGGEVIDLALFFQALQEMIGGRLFLLHDLAGLSNLPFLDDLFDQGKRAVSHGFLFRD
jgi:hypothetical protein